MASPKEHSLDITAKLNVQTFKDAINQVDKEVANRYDFKGTTYEVDFREKEKQLILIASSDNKLEALQDIVIAKLVKHELSSKILEELRTENASGNTRKCTYKIVDAIDSKEAKKIVAEIKNLNLKANAAIEGDAIRVKSKNIDDLQKVMQHLRTMEWESPIKFDNFR
ncbi:MAG: hypothetical protein KU37_06310 [Sulfuricurvum sp. PC08-66]|nr:MAG: hypothetical protein KU37_06310 [Sulfuricurvum sp. PC08-66]